MDAMSESEHDRENILLMDNMAEAQQQLRKQAKRAMTEDPKCNYLLLIAMVGHWWTFAESHRLEAVERKPGELTTIKVSKFKNGGLLATSESLENEDKLREILREKVDEILKQQK